VVVVFKGKLHGGSILSASAARVLAPSTDVPTYLLTYLQW